MIDRSSPHESALEDGPEIDLEQRLAELAEESKKRDTSRVAILETREGTAELKKAEGFFRSTLEAAQKKLLVLEEAVQGAENAAVVTRTVVFGLAFGVLALLGAAYYSKQSADLARQQFAASESEIKAQLDEIKKRGVAITVAKYKSESFDTGSVSCTVQSSGKNPCDCLYEIPMEGDKAKVQCEPMSRIAAANADAAVVIVTGGHDNQKLGESLRKTCGDNQCLASTRAAVMSNALDSSLSEVRRGATGSRQPFPVTRYVAETTGSEATKEKSPEDRTVVLTFVRASAEP